MRTKSFTFLIVVAIGIASCSMQTVESRKMTDAPLVNPSDEPVPVIVELFTSEGCSSCPSAERNLEFLAREQPVPEVEIIPLELHVDYWDRLGWKDPFSSAIFSSRQEYYGERFKLGSVYTPQFVIDGAFQASGNDSGAAAKFIMQASKGPKASVTTVVEGERLRIGIENMPKHETSSVFVAVYEDGLSRDVSAGENSGRTLRHNSVVRRLTAIGSIAADKSDFSAEYVLTLDPGWNTRTLGCVVFIQENASRRILGAVKVKIG